MFNKLKNYFELIKFSHTIFALPFALISWIIAEQGNLNWKVAFWIIVAMVGARSGAMGFNRWVDQKWDRLNPRTANRVSVNGEMQSHSILCMTIISFTVFIFATWNLNLLSFFLSPIAIFILCFYSYTKRFTSYSHFFLGFAIGISPIATWIATQGNISVISLLLGISVLTWITGFDILYALQDIDFDRNIGLFSIPATFGVQTSLWIARCLHACTAIFWFLLPYFVKLHFIYMIGVGIATILLVWEHSLIKKEDLSKLNVAFFNMNAMISILLFIVICLDFYFL